MKWEHQCGPVLVGVIPVLDDNYAYAVVRDGVALVVDPGEAAPIRRWLEERDLKLASILLTHSHRDHIGGLQDLVGDEAVTVISPQPEGLGVAALQCKDNDQMVLNGIQVKALATPGHTRIDTCFYLPEAEVVFTGDTLFIGGCGRLFECGAERMYASLDRLKNLPGDTWVFCGHEYTKDNFRFACAAFPDDAMLAKRRENLVECNVPSTIAVEMMTNVFFRADSVEDFARLRSAKDSFG